MLMLTVPEVRNSPVPLTVPELAKLLPVKVRVRVPKATVPKLVSGVSRVAFAERDSVP
jgi:hypothetical protein